MVDSMICVTCLGLFGSSLDVPVVLIMTDLHSEDMVSRWAVSGLDSQRGIQVRNQTQSEIYIYHLRIMQKKGRQNTREPNVQRFI